MSQQPLPPIGTRAVHKENHKDASGPVWTVDGHNQGLDPAKPIRLNAAKHKLNEGKPIPGTRHVSSKEFQDDYVQL